MAYAEKYELRSKGYRVYDDYTRESTDRTERRSCGDRDEMEAQERWLQKHAR